MQALRNGRFKDQAGGGLMLVLGLGAMVQGRDYALGTLAHMGPGFFPMALGALLAAIGVALIATADKNPDRKAGEAIPAEWRGWACIVLSLVLFVVLGKYGGLLPATFAIVFVSALGDRRNNLAHAVVLALAVMLACVVVFWWALQVQFPLFSWG